MSNVLENGLTVTTETPYPRTMVIADTREENGVREYRCEYDGVNGPTWDWHPESDLTVVEPEQTNNE